MFVKDKSKLSSEREYSPEGFLKVPARISRTGIQIYLASEMGLTDEDPEKIIKVYRPESEVFSEESLKSFSTSPITNDHPPELVDASNAKKYMVGVSDAAVVREGDYVKTFLIFTDADTIKCVESGKEEISNGYTADIDWTPGVTDSGEPYDAVQRNIIGNHIAVVTKGRAGSSCKVADQTTTTTESKHMATVTIDGVSYEVSEQAAQAVAKQQSRLNDAEKELISKEDELKKKKDEAEELEKEAKKKEDESKAKLDDALSKIPSAKEIDLMVADRSAFIAKVKTLDSELVITGKSESQIKSEIVAAHCPNVQLDSVSPDYVAARFDMLVEGAHSTSHNTLDSALADQLNHAPDSSQFDNRTPYQIARDKMINDSRVAWKPKEEI